MTKHLPETEKDNYALVEKLNFSHENYYDNIFSADSAVDFGMGDR